MLNNHTQNGVLRCTLLWLASKQECPPPPPHTGETGNSVHY